VVTGLEFWAPCDSLGPPNWGVWSAADTTLINCIFNVTAACLCLSVALGT